MRNIVVIGERDRDPVQSPDEWYDTKITYSDQGPLRSAWEARCGLCGRAGKEYRLSMPEVKAMRPLPPCDVCGGWMALELVPSTVMGASGPVRPTGRPVSKAPGARPA